MRLGSIPSKGKRFHSYPNHAIRYEAYRTYYAVGNGDKVAEA
jgi:hypothetical protein